MRPMARDMSRKKLPPPLRIKNDTYVADYWVGSHGERYRAHFNGKPDRSSLIHKLPRNRTSRHQIDVLQGLAPNDRDLPKIHDHDLQGDFIYVVLTWIPGRLLREFLSEGNTNPDSPFRLSAQEAVWRFTPKYFPVSEM